MAQLVRARLSEQEVPGSILGDFNVFRLSSDLCSYNFKYPYNGPLAEGGG